MPDFFEIKAQVIKYKKLYNGRVTEEYLEWAINHHYKIAQVVEDLTEDGDLVLDDGCGNRLHWAGIRNREIVGVDVDSTVLTRQRDCHSKDIFCLRTLAIFLLLTRIFISDIHQCFGTYSEKRTRDLPRRNEASG